MVRGQGYFITGFLGSGKTTLGIQLAAYALKRGFPIAYIVNDIGERNIDYERIVRAIPGIDAADLSAACIGCNGQEEFYGLLDAYHAKGVMLFIEPTGIFTGPEMQQIQHDVRGQWSLKIITLINTYQFLMETSAIALAKEGISQLAIADVIGLTWWNMLPRFGGISDKQFMPIHQFIGAHTQAPVYLIPEIISGELLETLRSITEKDKDKVRLSAIGEHFYHHNHDDHHDYHRHDHAHVGSWHTKSVNLRFDVALPDLIEVLAPVIEKIIRVKGDTKDESFDYVGGMWSTRSLTQEGSRQVVVISMEPLSEDILDQVCEGSAKLFQPSVVELEKAIAYLFKHVAPLSPGGKLLPIDGQTYAAYGVAMKLPDGHNLRTQAIYAIIERLVESCVVLRQGASHPPSIYRTAGAYLSFFALTHWEELLEEMKQQIIRVCPVELLVKGLAPLTEIGPGTGITGGTVRPSSLKNGAYRFATLHEPDSVESLIAVFRHCSRVAIPNVKQEWEDLLNEISV